MELASKSFSKSHKTLIKSKNTSPTCSNPQLGFKNPSYMSSFKQKLNLNPTFFLPIKNSDLTNEIKRLKEENWKLRQELLLKTEEIKKLKFKMSHNFNKNPDFLLDKTSYNDSFIETLNDSLKGLESELKVTKKGMVELKKNLLFKQQEPKYIDWPINQITKQSITEPSENSRVSDLNKTIKSLKSEISVLQDQKQAIESEFKIYKERKEKKGSDFRLKIEKLSSIIVNGKRRLFRSRKNFSSSAHEKLLKRQKSKNSKFDIDLFFKRLAEILSFSKVNPEDLCEYIDTHKEIIGKKDFMKILENFNIKILENEVTELIFELEKKGKVNKRKIISLIQRFCKQGESNLSSDLSSRSNISSTQSRNIDQIKDAELDIIFDNISLNFRQAGITRQVFVNECQENLPDFLNFTDFSVFLNELLEFVLDPSDVATAASYLFEDREYLKRDEAIGLSLIEFFKYSDCFKNDPSEIDEVLKRLNGHSEYLIKILKEKDDSASGELSWAVLSDLLYSNNYLLEREMEGFKFFCFFLSKDLKKIPYWMLFKEKEEKSEETE